MLKFIFGNYRTTSIFRNYRHYCTNNNKILDMSDNRAHRLVWVDLEMTGLDLNKDVIMEMAVIVTDENLNVIESGPNLVVKVDEDKLQSMNKWCTEHHGQSGLTQRCRDSKITTQEAEKIMVEFIQKHTDKGLAPLCGNSVHEDKKFLNKEMPLFSDWLHYRIVDVSTIKELSRRWYPNELKKAPKKQMLHRALDDIIESIEELKYYRTNVFK
ncbi:RNA exonuclease 2 [Tieghemostelium lacteum]|uniref:RNA exonuclease 2 n=1 Tax=Tieghemostelium lacteum TaxID=361077 RepID=A0A152AA08_TIELA|nr:RNA exonuclease 2 [Tieghemostelium lacteum]|eukprot:KYR03044.1 RNA exonuclease 2 [Tieghemostelium lacteum]